MEQSRNENGAFRTAGEGEAAVLRMEKLCKSYDGKPVLKDFTEELREGECCVLTGPSGSGKTTLLRLILGLEEADAGQIRSPRPLKTSVVFQEDRLFENMSAAENVAEALSEILPADELDKPVAELSGGMRRRVCLVRACLYPSDLLLLDEPFTGLDDKNRALCIRFLLKHRKGRTLLLSSHGTEGLEFCREINVVNLN